MLFVFSDDGTLEVIEGLKGACHYEGIDVESGVFRFYDESGRYLQPRFTKPNKTGRFLWFFRWVESGKFELAPVPAAGQDTIWTCLQTTTVLSPNPWFQTLDDVKRFLTQRCQPTGSA